jgi:hypothetical protein
MMYSSSMPSILLLLCSLLGACWRQAEAYPMLSQVDEGDERCFSFNIPANDDAHMVFVVLPGEDDIDDEEEAWYVEQVLKLTKLKSQKEGIPNKFPDDMPSKVAKHVTKYVEEAGSNESPITIQVSVDPESGENPAAKYKERQRTKYFLPTVFGHVRKAISMRAHNQGPKADSHISYRVCFLNADADHQAQVILDVVLLSEEILDEENSSSSGFVKDKHLTPLEQSLQSSITAANSVLKEMKYMEQREARMRETAESINTRVRWFSYLSVAVLLVVTYIQVTYLKRYFHKKKLM